MKKSVSVIALLLSLLNQEAQSFTIPLKHHSTAPPPGLKSYSTPQRRIASSYSSKTQLASSIESNLFDTSTLPLQLPTEIVSILAPILENLSSPNSPSILIPLIAFSTLTTISFQILSNPPSNFRQNAEPYLRGQYNPQQARSYYSQRPLLVLRRALQILRLSNTFIFNLLIDKYIFRNEERNKEQKGQDLLKLIQAIGPTAIKVGQALSVRSDLIPEYYASALVELQDNVPPFDSKEAVMILKRELGNDVFESTFEGVVFDKPVASASIGQVYKGIAKNVPMVEEIVNEEDGTVTTQSITKDVQVAIKVQRPNVLSEISLDLFLVREFAPIYQAITKTSTDLQALANEWGRGFIDELTYEQEQKNTIDFNHQMKKKNLNAICAPNVVESLSTDQVLVTEWVDGTRLDKSQEKDVARLCGIALNAYLVMLLETGVLHCGESFVFKLIHMHDAFECIALTHF